MKILIVAATRPEIAPVYDHFGLPDRDFVQTDEFDILITGVGMVATAFALGQKLAPLYKLVLNLGIAGSFNRDIPLGTVLNVTSDEFSELGAEDGENFIPIDVLGFGKSRFSTRYDVLNDALAGLQQVKGITVNLVHGREQSISAVTNRLKPEVESMEGAAVCYAAEQAGLPWVQVRSISNYVERRNRENWKIGPAVDSLNEWAIRFLTKA